MKAVILAAGKGLRMLLLTKAKPKTLIEVNGEDFLVLGEDNFFSPADLLTIQKDDEYCYARVGKFIFGF